MRGPRSKDAHPVSVFRERNPQSLTVEHCMWCVFADPVAEFAAGLVALELDVGESAAVGWGSEASPIHIDHASPRARINVLLAIGINLVHRPVGVAEDDGFHFWVLV